MQQVQNMQELYIHIKEHDWDIIRGLQLIYEVLDEEDMEDHVEFI
jgi:hypothetical protein